MPRREPDGDTGVEVAIDRIRDIERELEDLKAFVAGKLPHDHDGRYVNESGDTMSGDLHQDQGTSGSSIVLHRERSGAQHDFWFMTWGDDLRLRMRIDGTIVSNLFLRDSQVEVVDADFDVTNGSKNARIADPDDPTKAYRFAAVEADEPGLLIHRRTVTIPEGNGGEATVDLPAHWSRIARDGDAMVTPLNDTRDQAPAAAVVDLTVPEVTVRGKPGDYRVWVAAARADAGVDGWTHEVEVTPDDEDV